MLTTPALEEVLPSDGLTPTCVAETTTGLGAGQRRDGRPAQESRCWTVATVAAIALIAAGAMLLAVFLPGGSAWVAIRWLLLACGAAAIFAIARPFGRSAIPAILTVVAVGGLSIFSVRTMVMAVYERSSTGGLPPVARSYFAELDVNDYPQTARFKITHKDTLSAVTEFTGAAVMVKGEYIPPGKAVREGHRRLYIRIDSSSEVNVEKALKELKRILFETMTEAAERGNLDSLRYGL